MYRKFIIVGWRVAEAERTAVIHRRTQLDDYDELERSG
jgi:hypothetical protein